MSVEIGRFVHDTVIRLSDGVNELSGAEVLGGSGLGLDSMAIAELAVLAEGEYGLDLVGEELDRFAELTVDEFVADLARRVDAQAPGRSG